MTDDATLTDFLDGADGADADDGDADGTVDTAAESGDVAGNDALEADEDDSVEDDGDGGGDAIEDVDPARATYAWGIERTCDACGERVERWWRGGEGVVCPGCKDW